MPLAVLILSFPLWGRQGRARAIRARADSEGYKLGTRLTESGLKELESYTWPGNVRQLQHLGERLTILAPGARIDAESVKIAIEAAEPRDSSRESLADAEAEEIRRVMAATNGNKSRAARILGIERKTLYRKLEKMGLA